MYQTPMTYGSTPGHSYSSSQLDDESASSSSSSHSSSSSSKHNKTITVVEIPLRKTKEVLDLELSDLPDFEDLLKTFISESVPLDKWLIIAVSDDE